MRKPIASEELLVEPNRGKRGRPKKVKPEDTLPVISLLDIERELYRQSFYEFYKAAYRILEPTSDYKDNWHIQYLCDTLQAEAERIARREKKHKDIIINVPFRSSKSLICTIVFPAWCWIKYPSLRFITASYSASLSLGLGTQSRDLLVSDWFRNLFPELELKADNNAKGEFENSKTGKRISTSVGGTITGKGANIIIVDDASKPDEAQSAVKLKEVQEWYDGTISNRLNDFDIDVRIIVMQRLALNDLCGYLLEKMPHRFHHICIPATDADKSNIKPTELQAYYVDGLFWPNRFTYPVLANFKEDMGTKKYANQLMQKALPSEGGKFKESWFKGGILTEEAFATTRNGRVVEWQLFLDGAETADVKNDASCYLLAAKLDNQLFIRDVVWVRKAFTDLVKDVTRYLATSPVKISRVLIEGKSVGKHLLSQLRQDIPAIPFVELQPGRDSKAVRADSITPFCEGGRVHLLKGSWNEAFLEEVTAFTDGKSGHDDSVDVLVYAVQDAKTSGFWFSPV